MLSLPDNQGLTYGENAARMGICHTQDIQAPQAGMTFLLSADLHRNSLNQSSTPQISHTFVKNTFRTDCRSSDLATE